MQQIRDALGLRGDRPALGNLGHGLGDIEEAGDPSGWRCVYDDFVEYGFALLIHPDRAFLDLAGQNHITQTGCDRSDEFDGTDPTHRPPGEAQVVEHIEVFEKGVLDIECERDYFATAVRGGDPGLGGRQRWQIEQLGNGLSALHLDQQHPSSARGQRECQRRGDG